MLGIYGSQYTQYTCGTAASRQVVLGSGGYTDLLNLQNVVCLGWFQHAVKGWGAMVWWLVVIRSSTPCKLQHSMIFRPAPCCLGQPSMRPISRHARSVRTRKATKLLGDLHFVVFKFSRCKCVLDQIQKWVSVGGGELRSISLYIVSPRFAIQIHYKAMVPA